MTLTEDFTYDTLGRVGRVDSQTDPALIKVQNVYNPYGHLAQIRHAQTLQVYWMVAAVAADGQLTPSPIR